MLRRCMRGGAYQTRIPLVAGISSSEQAALLLCPPECFAALLVFLAARGAHSSGRVVDDLYSAADTPRHTPRVWNPRHSGEGSRILGRILVAAAESHPRRAPPSTQSMSDVFRVRTLEEIKAAKVAQAAQPSSAAQSSSTKPSTSSSTQKPSPPVKPPPAPSPPVKKYGQWKAGLEAVLSAARAGKTDRVRQLLDEHASLRLDHADADQYSLLHGLAQHNHPTLIALLLEKGLHEKGAKAQCVDAVDKWRVTPLMLAAVNGNGECALLLLRHGAALLSKPAAHRRRTIRPPARPRQHRVECRAASSPGQPRPIGRCALAGRPRSLVRHRRGRRDCRPQGADGRRPREEARAGCRAQSHQGSERRQAETRRCGRGRGRWCSRGYGCG